MQNAWKVGLFVVVFGALLIAAYAMIGQNLFAKKPMMIQATFSDAGGINPGAKVQMAGVVIGTVTHVKLDSPTRAMLDLAINNGIEIPAGSTAVLPTSFIGIGDNPVQIVPPAQSSGLVKEGDILPGRRLGALDAIAPGLGPGLSTTLDEVNKTLKATRELISDQGIRTELVSVLEQTSKTLDQFAVLAAGANSTLNENRAAIRSTLATFASAMKDVEKTASMAAELLADPKYRTQANEILASLNATAKRAESIMANVESLVADPDLKAGIKKTVEDMNAITDSGTRIASNSEKITANGISASENVVELTKKVNLLADDVKVVLEKIKGFFEKPASVGSMTKLQTVASLQYLTRPDRLQADFNAKYPISGGNIHLGVFDAFETNRLNAQIGRPMGKAGEYRYGMYAGKAGLGVDFNVSSKVKIRGDLYGLNDPKLNVRTEFDFRNDILGWIGIDRLGDRNSLAVGVGIRK